MSANGTPERDDCTATGEEENSVLISSSFGLLPSSVSLQKYVKISMYEIKGVLVTQVEVTYSSSSDVICPAPSRSEGGECPSIGPLLFGMVSMGTSE